MSCVPQRHTSQSLPQHCSLPPEADTLGLKLAKEREKTLQTEVEYIMTENAETHRELLDVLNQMRTAPNEHRQRFLNLLFANDNVVELINVTGLWRWATDDNFFAA